MWHNLSLNFYFNGRTQKEPLPENVFSKNDRYAHYLSFAILVSHVAFVGIVLCEFPCRDIFVRFYLIFQLWVPSMEKCPKFRRKYLCTVTLIKQPPQRLHSLPRWHIKDNGNFQWEALFVYANWGWDSNLDYVTLFECCYSGRAWNKWLIPMRIVTQIPFFCRRQRDFFMQALLPPS